MSVISQHRTSPARRHAADERAGRRAPARPAQKAASDVRTWLIALVVIGVVLLAFLGMVALTAAAGGDTFLS